MRVRFVQVDDVSLEDWLDGVWMAEDGEKLLKGGYSNYLYLGQGLV